MMKRIRFIAVLVAALSALLSLSTVANASTAAAQRADAQVSVDNAPRTQFEVCDFTEYDFEVECDLLDSDDPRLEVTVYFHFPWGREKVAEWVFRASGNECVTALGYTFCLDVDFDWDAGCVTIEATVNNDVIWGPKTACW